MTYRKLCYHECIDDWSTVYMAELDSENYTVRAVDIYSDGSYGYSDEKIYVNVGSLSDVPFPAVDEFYHSGEYDSDMADYYDITKEDFEAAWEAEIAFCRNHNIAPKKYAQ